MKRRMFLSVIVSVFVLCSCSSTTSYDDAVSEFANPTSYHGVSCWWWWLNGNVDSTAISNDLESMHEKGFCGAMIFDAGGYNQCGNNNVPAGPMFGTPEWQNLFLYALDKARTLGLEMGFNIQSGWNLGGPCITKENAAKKLIYSKVTLDGAGECETVLPIHDTVCGFYKDIAVLAFPVNDSMVSEEPIHYLEHKLSIHELGMSAPDCRFLLNNSKSDNISASDIPYILDHNKVIDVSDSMDADGNFRWKCPEGKWVVMRIGYTCTGAKVSTSSETWQGLVLDYLKSDALDFYLETVIDPILTSAGDHVGTTLRYLETDSWECGGMNWTDSFPSDFESLNGYSLMQYLPVIGGYVVDDMETTHAFLADFRKTVGYDVAHNHYAHLAKYAHSKGMGVQPESAGPHAGPFDGVRNFSFSDIVMGEFWAPSPHRPRPADRFFMKQASSAAHIYGKKIVGAESFTTIGPHWNDRIWHNQKPSFDHEICAGLNRVYFHTFTCSPEKMGLPGQEYFAGTHVNPRVTWWNESYGFIDYMSRIQSLVQESTFKADVLYYYGDHIPVIFPYKHSDMAGTMPGFDFDVTCEDALLRCKTDKNGNIVVPSGLSYKLLVLPDHKVLSLAVLEKIDTLLRCGATILGYKPEKTVSLVGGAEAKARFSELSDSIWGASSDKGEKLYGNGTVAWGVRANEYLLSKGIPCDFSVTEDPNLEKTDFIHYILDGRDVYFIANLCDSTSLINCTFRTGGRNPELWDATSGKIYRLGTYTDVKDCVSVPLRLDPCGSAIVMFDGKAEDLLQDNFIEYSPVMDIQGPWKVTFDDLGQVDFPILSDWTQSEDQRIKYYSGHATYTCNFEFCQEVQPNYFIDLGEIMDVGMARVTINGNDAGLVWTKPFIVQVGQYLKKGVNTLEVTVVNSWYNRVAGDQLSGGGKTSTNIQLVHDGKVNLSPSGLLGPVKLSIIID